ncbi:hypothetical protein KPH14_002025 [Odynerus spinipes]|uniref:Uncharacterized protein n=1 Tax=Odynerus spinipes TaxID=1348599 RepID=A0AAD9S1B3_9HYME|nr:hypothetical protein KPH14_002025 [Odynerus spinipes]
MHAKNKIKDHLKCKKNNTKMISRYIRRMSREKREWVQSRLAILYAVVAWNGFAICLYMMYNQRNEAYNLPKGLIRAAQSESIQNAEVVRIRGFNVVEKLIYGKEEIDEARLHMKNVKSTDDSDDF